MTYDDLVDTDKQTCSACPTQWEGRLKDGREFYFRYRHGYASLELYGIASGQAGMVTHPNGMADGVLYTEQYHEVFVQLYNQIQLEIANQYVRSTYE